MSLIEKFDSVKITADTCLTQTEQAFCLAHQNAYETAKESLLELDYFWSDILAVQRTALSSTDTSPLAYLTPKSCLKISSDAIQKELRATHSAFIENLVSYFNSNYHICISAQEIKEKLLPKQPENSSLHDETLHAYHQELQNCSLSSNQILEQILLQLNGRSFLQEAFHQLRGKCHKAAWNTYQKCANYERKKSVLQFTHYACSYKSWPFDGKWELNDSMKHILRGIIHYETDSFTLIPREFSELLGYGYHTTNEITFTTCKKIKSLKAFKNGRVDLRFTEEGYAKEFAETYLGTIC